LNCDGNSANACDQVEDATHCGAECVDCTPQFANVNRVGVCSGGSCVAGDCVPGYAPCIFYNGLCTPPSTCTFHPGGF
jgi:hypothetical protein